MITTPFGLRKSGYSAFTLIELLVVISIIAILATMAMVTVGMVRDRVDSTACLSNLRQLGMSFQAYAIDNDGMIPSGQLSPTARVGYAWAGIWYGFTQPYLSPSDGVPLWHCRKSVFKLIEVRAFSTNTQFVSSYGMNSMPWSTRGVAEFNHRMDQIPRPGEVILLGDRWGTRDGLIPDGQPPIDAPYKTTPMTGPRRAPPGGSSYAAVRLAHPAGSGTDITNGRFNGVYLDGHAETNRWQDTCGASSGVVPNRWDAKF